jgi:two-component system response regulator HydG
MNTKILIVEDQFIEANNLELILKKAGYRVCPVARSVQEAIKIIGQETPDLVLLDIMLRGPLTGIDLAKTLKKENIAFVYLSANSDKKIFTDAKATKPYGFLVKPFREKDILVMLEVALYLHQQEKEQNKNNTASGLPPQANSPDILKNIIAGSPDMQEVLGKANMVAKTDTSVLLLGESGTGKEVIANAIHYISSRSSKPLIVVNCAALPANLIESELFGHEKGTFTGAVSKRIGKFEQADGGTIFLDEIGELPLDLQIKFLRVLQEKEIEPIGGSTRKVDVRVIAATNRDLEDEVIAGRFRMDLYYRLNAFPILLPSLRERKSDISALARHFLDKYDKLHGKSLKLSAAALGELTNYYWPGNVRELENIIERHAILANGPIIETIELQQNVKNIFAKEPKPGKLKTLVEHERDYLIEVLEKCNWKIYGPGGAAEVLDVNVSTLNSRIKKLGIKKR